MQTLLQLDIWLQCYEGFNNAKNNERKEFAHCFCQYLKNNIPDIRLIPIDHVTYYWKDTLSILTKIFQQLCVKMFLRHRQINSPTKLTEIINEIMSVTKSSF